MRMAPSIKEAVAEVGETKTAGKAEAEGEGACAEIVDGCGD